MAPVVAGIDGYRKGWIALVFEGERSRAFVAPRLHQLVQELGDADVIALDMPIGLPDAGPRTADILARQFVGPRRNSVFLTPPRSVWEAETIEEARRRSVAMTGSSISSQTYALRPRIFEADEAARADTRLREVHPEVSFAALAGGHLPHAKATWAGFALRRRLLADAGILISDDLGPAGAAGMDDVLDAAVAAWSARRMLAGSARSLPSDPERGTDGHRAAIWY